MRKVVIVDDEVIVRVTLRTLIHWDTYGLEIEADFSDGKQALEYLERHPADLLITDIKMPEISGLELMRIIREWENPPVVVALSGYNEYALVREAFRMGAFDYLLKEDMNADNLGHVLEEISGKIWKNSGWKEAKREADNKKEELPEKGEHGVLVIEVDDFQKQAVRFQKNLKEQMEIPMQELVNQIPKIKRRGRFLPVQPGHFVFLYEVTQQEVYRTEILLLVKQMQAIWHNYMNLTVSVAVCEKAEAENIKERIEEGENLLILSPLKGKSAVVTQWENEKLLLEMEEVKKRNVHLVQYLYEGNMPEFDIEKRKFFQRMDLGLYTEAKEEMLGILACLALKFREYDDDFFAMFPEKINYYEKLERMQTVRELELWIHNYFRWVQEYLKQKHDGKQADAIQKAKNFMADNFSNPELTLGTVADYIGLNEKYFSSRFTKETGYNFRDYLTKLRIHKAKKLLESTDLKIYEISERAGYSSVEHFNRMFKKSEGISPRDYKKSE